MQILPIIQENLKFYLSFEYLWLFHFKILSLLKKYCLYNELCTTLSHLYCYLEVLMQILCYVKFY